MSNRTTKVRTAVVGLGWPGMQHLKGYGKEPISSAEQGIMLMQMLDGIYESAEKGRSVPIADLSFLTM